MAKRVTQKTTTNAVVPISTAVEQPSPAAEPVLAKMTSFTHAACEEHPDISFTRYWWEDRYNREGIEPWLRKKLYPGEDPIFGVAAKTEVLLPSTASSEYMQVGFLARRFDETLPPFQRHAMVQVKIFLERQEAWHIAYERVRSYAWAHFAHRFPTILIAHIPAVAGLKGRGNHIHCVVLSRGLTVNGFTGACTALCSDTGYEEAIDAWQAHVAQEGETG